MNSIVTHVTMPRRVWHQRENVPNVTTHRGHIFTCT